MASRARHSGARWTRRVPAAARDAPVSSPGSTTPRSLALDPRARKLYWTELGARRILHADLDGQNVEDLISSGVGVPRYLALDAVGGKIYWTHFNPSKLQRTNLDGSGVEDLATAGGLPSGIALDLAPGRFCLLALAAALATAARVALRGSAALRRASRASGSTGFTSRERPGRRLQRFAGLEAAGIEPEEDEPNSPKDKDSSS